jgi:hypothetical protein
MAVIPLASYEALRPSFCYFLLAQKVAQKGHRKNQPKAFARTSPRYVLPQNFRFALFAGTLAHGEFSSEIFQSACLWP